jgi:hypothetical protein
MKTFRVIAGVPALLVLVFFAAAILLPPVMNDQYALLECLFPAIGIPILIINMWAWGAPELIEGLFFAKI